MSAGRIPKAPRKIRVIGFDDSPFTRQTVELPFVGAVCSGTRFEGMVSGRIARDGLDAAERIAECLLGSKYLPQVHVVLLDGIAMGGLNLIDLPALSEALSRPCITFTRKLPDLEAMRRAIAKLPQAAARLEILERAGELHERQNMVFQCAGIVAPGAEDVLRRTRDRGHVPEALRLAHLIASGMVNGESRGRA